MKILCFSCFCVQIVGFFGVVLLLFVLFNALFVCKCVLYYCHRVTTQLELKNISYHIIQNDHDSEAHVEYIQTCHF